MDPNTLAMMMGAAGAAGGEKIYIEDVFSTWLYTGNGSTQTIANGIDLSGKGGLVWLKSRSAATDHQIFDTARGATKEFISNSVAAEATDTDTLTAFNADGFSLGADANTNTSSAIYASWTFRKAAKFFDVVTYTGNGTTQNVAHSLGSKPGCIIVKRIDAADNWGVWHRGNGSTFYSVFSLNTTGSSGGGSDVATSTTFAADNISGSSGVPASFNVNGATYVAYLFAHDAGGFGDNGNDSVISCGSYAGNSSSTAGPTVTLGWEPQWLLIKRADSTGDWNLIDNMRGFVAGDTDTELNANLSNAESRGTFVTPLPNGFQITSGDTGYNASGGTYIYIAIRRGPMETPTDATAVFQPKVYTGTNVDSRLVVTDIVTDMAWVRQRDDAVLSGMVVGDRLRGQQFLFTGSIAAGAGDVDSFDQELVSITKYGTAWSSMTGFWVGNDTTRKLNADTTSNNHVALAFRRASGFFDVVAYTGTGSARTIAHNLGVAPELMIVKGRSLAESWAVYNSFSGASNYLFLNSTAASASDGSGLFWNLTAPTSSVFSLGSYSTVNNSGSTFIAYLFASCPGVSKVGFYTGNGSSQTINCGFAAGARFVLIKRTDNTGNWLVADTARGLVSGNDPLLYLNSTAAEITTLDWIDPDSTGFIVNQEATANANVNGAAYIYLAVA